MSWDEATLSPAWLALGSAVVHFLWQGALIGLVTWMALGGLRRRSSTARYAVASGALLLCLLTFVGTFVATLALPSTAGAGAALQLAHARDATAGGAQPGFGAVEIAACCWALGVLCMAVRFTVLCLRAHRLRTTDVSTPAAPWQHVFRALQEELGVTRAVRLVRSGLAEVPMVVGWLSPIVLVPASAFTALSPDQLRLLLIHELAHIRRHDHLLNAVQAVVEILLFFHPLVWWISKQTRLEREYCCDDSSVRLTGNARLFADALACMEALRTANPPTATVLASNGGPLMQRITRILGERFERRSSFSGWQLPAGLALAGLLAVASNAYAGPAPDAEADAAAQHQEHSPRDAGETTDEDAQRELRRRRLRMHYAEEEARVKAAVQAGEMSAAEAKRILEGIRMRMRYAAEEERVKAAVQAGEMTAEEAKRTLEGIRMRMHYAAEETRVKAAVKAGEMSAAEAKRILAGIAARMKKAGEQGELTPDQTLERIDAYRRSLEAGGEAANPKLEYAALEARIMKAVKAGEMTGDQARAKLAQAREKLELGAVIQRIEQAVKAGRITPEEGKARLEAFEKGLAERRKAGARDDQRALDYRAMAAKIRAAVAAGELSKEDAERKLIELRERMAADEDQARKHETLTIEEYRRAEAEMNKLVEEGKLEAEDVERRLIEMRKRIAKERAEQSSGRSRR